MFIPNETETNSHPWAVLSCSNFSTRALSLPVDQQFDIDSILKDLILIKVLR